MSDRNNPWNGNDPGKLAFETLAAASALGVTIATQAAGFWLSVLSGATAPAREADVGREPKVEPKPQPAPARPSAEVVELKPKAKAEQPAPVADKPAAIVAAPVAEPVKVAAPMKTAKPKKAKAAPKAAPVVAAPAAAPVKAEPAVEMVKAEPVADLAKVEEPKPVADAKPAAAVEAAMVEPVIEAKPAPVVEVAKPEPAVDAKPAPAAEPAKAAALMPEDFRQPKAQDKPAQPDDLKQIKGVGPKLEVTLNGLGLWTYQQIATLSEAEIAWLDDYLGLSGRIARDGWVGAAATLGGKNRNEAAQAGGDNG